MPRARDRQPVLSIVLLAACCALAGALPASAASSWGDVPRAESEREALEAIARHPEALREAAMRVATQPELIVRIEGIRSWSSRGFGEVLGGHDDAERADLWELTRYPELIAAIVEDDPEGLEEVLGDAPAEVQAAASRAMDRSPDTLQEIDALQREIHAAFDDVLQGVEPELADALERVASEPALLSVLAENLELTVALGKAYEREPEELRAWLADLSGQVAAADARQRDEWSEAIQEDEGLREQVVEAAAAWDDQHGRRDAYDQGYEDGYARADHLSHVRPYPYWYGYPAFHADVFVPAAHAHTLWYPRSRWGHLGFHQARGHSLVVFSAPSFPFLYWLRVQQPHHRYVRSYPHHRRVRRVQHARPARRAHHAHHYRADRIRESRHETRKTDERRRVARSQLRKDAPRRHARWRLDEPRRHHRGRGIDARAPGSSRKKIETAKPGVVRKHTAKAKPGKAKRKHTAKAKPDKAKRKRTAKAKPDKAKRKRVAKAKQTGQRDRAAHAKRAEAKPKRTAKAKPAKANRKRTARAKPAKANRKRTAKAKPAKAQRKRTAKAKEAKPKAERKRTAKAKRKGEKRGGESKGKATRQGRRHRVARR